MTTPKKKTFGMDYPGTDKKVLEKRYDFSFPASFLPYTPD